MTLPESAQPNLPNKLGNQTSISRQLYDLILRTVRSRNELERAWETVII